MDVGGLRGTHKQPGSAGSDPSRAGGCSGSVSGEVLHLSNLQTGKPWGVYVWGEGNKQVFPR